MPGCTISSRGRGLAAALSLESETAWAYGRLKGHYPVFLEGREFPDAHAAWKALKRRQDTAIMTRVLAERFRQNPVLVTRTRDQGGSGFLLTCSYDRGNSTWDEWEGHGAASLYIQCLVLAYEEVAGEQEPDRPLSQDEAEEKIREQVARWTGHRS